MQLLLTRPKLTLLFLWLSDGIYLVLRYCGTNSFLQDIFICQCQIKTSSPNRHLHNKIQQKLLIMPLLQWYSVFAKAALTARRRSFCRLWKLLYINIRLKTRKGDVLLFCSLCGCMMRSQILCVDCLPRFYCATCAILLTVALHHKLMNPLQLSQPTWLAPNKSVLRRKSVCLDMKYLNVIRGVWRV